MAILSLVLLLFALAAHVNALSKTYERGPAPLGENAQLYWTLRNDTRQISFALTVNDTAVLSESDVVWIALGVSEDTSGSMLGSDIASAEFGPQMLDNCTLRDRYVPFVAYPIGETSVNGSTVFPHEDECQGDGSWKLVSCTRNPIKGSVTLEVERSLDAHDDQDRAISSGSQIMIYAYGASGFAYHGKNRRSSHIVLFNEDGTYPKTEELPLPLDASYVHTLVATNYSVPSANVTTYASTSSIVPIPKGGKRALVAVDPIIMSLSGQNKAHHLVIFACRHTAFAKRFTKTTYSMNDGPFENPGDCTALLYVWAVGIGRFLLPENVGFEIDESNNYLVMETHYDNPDRGKNAVDVSGVKLYFADTRPIRAGMLALGDPGASLFGRTIKSEFEYMSTCPSNCTSTWKEEINVFVSLLHMHTTGRKIYTNRFDKDGKFIEPINAIEFWSNDHQHLKQFKKPKKIVPGDILSTTCVYDTSKRPSTKFGLATREEMCVDFLFYYPLQKRFPSDSEFFACSMYKLRGNNTATLCGSAGDNRTLVLQANPSFNDTVDTPENFGTAPSTCVVKNINGSGSAVSPTKIGARCFPGSGVVQTRNGKMLISDLDVGDEVLVGNGTYSKVFMFTHRVATGKHDFVELSSSGHKITLTHDHYLYANGALTPAGIVRVGDTLRMQNGSVEKVVRVRNVIREGLYNPQTLQGDIVVDGITSSTYTKALQPSAAHALLMLFRGAMKAFGWNIGAFERDEYVAVRWFSYSSRFVLQEK